MICVGIASGIREIIQLQLDNEWEPSQQNEPKQFVLSDVDPVAAAITLILTMTFYPLLYLSYSYIYKGSEERDASIVLYNFTLITQFAILRDLLDILFALLSMVKSYFRTKD